MKSLILLLWFGALAPLPAQKLTRAEAQLEAATQREVVAGDLKGAIALYKKAAESSDRKVAARALVRLGQCYEKLGDAEARGAYEKAIKNYADQPDAVAEARSRLARLAGNASQQSAVAQLLVRQKQMGLGASRISADGRYLPFQHLGTIRLRDMTTGEERTLSPARERTPDMWGWGPVLSRDSQWVAANYSVSANENELWLMRTQGNESRKVPIDFADGGFAGPQEWSHDGKQVLAWVMKRSPQMWNIALVDVETGALRPLSTATDERCTRATFSPDGKHVVTSCLTPPSKFWKLKMIEVATARGTMLLQSPGNEESPVWVPGSDRILYRGDQRGKNGLWSVRYQNGAASAPELLLEDIGEAILLGAKSDGTVYYGRQEGTADVFEVTLDGWKVSGQPRIAFDAPPGRTGYAAYSPSGNAIAYTRREGDKPRLVIRQNDGKEALAADSLRWANSHIHWCAENQVLAWGTPLPDTKRTYDAHTGVASGDDVKIQGLKAPYQLGYSPNCDAVYVSTYSFETRRRRIYRIDLATQQQTDIATDNGDWAQFPMASPDGNWLILHGNLEPRGKSGLLIVPTSGGALRMLDQTSEGPFAWSRDSQRILYTKRNQGQDEVWMTNPEGSTRQPLGLRAPDIASLSLHNNGNRLLFTGVERISEVWSLRIHK